MRTIVNSMCMFFFRHTLLAAVLGAAMREAAAEGGNYFNPAFLADDPSLVADLSRFERGNQNLPGVYRMDLVVNGIFIDTRDITFVEGNNIYPCVSRVLLEEVAVNLDALQPFSSEDSCLNLQEIVPDSSFTTDFEKLRLDLSLPQAVMKVSLRGYIPPSRWDEGIPAAMLNYQYSGSHSIGSSIGGTEQFLSLQSGLNSGPWRLRDHSSVQKGLNGGLEWQHVSTTLERAIIPWRSSMAAGETWTGGDIFDSVRLRGIKLSSDDMMLPDSMRGFAPVVRGIARTAARVTVSQNGYEIYQTQVQPGAFEFADLYTISTAGDLTVSIYETDGRTEIYTVPYSSVPILRREGQVHYEVALGKLDGGQSSGAPQFVQGTVVHGLPAGLTAYTGLQLSPDYLAVAIGAAKNMGFFGAVSADLIQARTQRDSGDISRGQSMRFLYARSLNDLGTSFQLMGYRYSTEGFYTISESTVKEDTENSRHVKKGRAQVSISQHLPGVGSLYLNGSQQTYWNSENTDRFIQTGINGQVRQLSWNIAWSESHGSDGGSDRALTLGFSVPLGSPSRDGSGGLLSRSYSSWGMTHDMKGRMQNRAGLSGAANDDGSMSYSMQLTHESGGNGESGSGQLSWNSPHVNMNVGVAHASGSSKISGSLAGSLLAHADGVTFGQPIGESSVLIDTGGAKGVKVENMQGIATDERGYAVLPWANAYRDNRIALDVNSTSQDTDVEEAVQNVVPTRGAVVKATFSTRSGQRVLVTLSRDGRPLPFGSLVTLLGHEERKPVSGIVGDDGQVYLAGMPLEGELEAVWGMGRTERCVARVSIPAQTQGLHHLSATCA